MADVTRILNRIDQGDPQAADELLPQVYDELRRLAAARLSHEKPGQTLQATALVHEAYMRLVGQVHEQEWNGRGHFFSAAAEAMRRILVERARQRKADKHGGRLKRVEFDQGEGILHRDPDEVLNLNEAIDVVSNEDATAAQLAKLKIFLGLSVQEAAGLLGVSRATAYRHWTYAKARLKDLMR